MLAPRTLLFLTVLIDLIGFGIVIPIMPFMIPALGGSVMDIAWIIAIYSVCGALVGPFWGRMSDRFGRKPIILLCLAGGALSYVMLAFATSMIMVYVARIFAGLMAGNFGVASAMMADITPPQERAKGMGMIGAAFGLGMVLGPALGGLLAGDSNNYQLPCLAASVVSFVALIAGLIFLPESLPKEKRAEQAKNFAGQAKQSLYGMLKTTGNRLLVSQYLLHSTCITVVSFMFPLWVGHLLGWGAKEVGYVFGVQGLAMAALQGGFIGKLTKRFGELNFLVFGVSVMVVGFIVAMTVDKGTSMWIILLAFFMSITGATCCTPILNSIVSKRTPPQFRGRMMGTTASFSSWGRVVAPVIAGGLLTQFDNDYTIGWLFAAIVACVFWVWAVREKQTSKAVEEQ